MRMPNQLAGSTGPRYSVELPSSSGLRLVPLSWGCEGGGHWGQHPPQGAGEGPPHAPSTWVQLLEYSLGSTILSW